MTIATWLSPLQSYYRCKTTPLREAACIPLHLFIDGVTTRHQTERRRPGDREP